MTWLVQGAPVQRGRRACMGEGPPARPPARFSQAALTHSSSAQHAAPVADFSQFRDCRPTPVRCNRKANKRNTGKLLRCEYLDATGTAVLARDSLAVRPY